MNGKKSGRSMGLTRAFKCENIILRERKGRYYVYKLETINGEVKETYVGPLADVVETYEKLKDSSGGVGVSPTWARWDLNPGSSPCEGDVLTKLDDGPFY